MKIGIYDSGIGGLSVLHHARKVMPDAQFLYYADEKHVPYGEKTREEIKGYVEETLNFLIEKGADAVVIACNTATSVAEKEFRNTFPIPIVGMEPAVKKAVKQQKNTDKRIMVTATPITIYGKKLENLIQKVDADHIVDKIPLPMLVRFAERCYFDSPEIDEYLREELKKFDLTQYGSVVLGCTHFNYFKEHFQAVFPGEIHFADGNEGTIRQLMRVLPKNLPKEDIPGVTYYYSGRPVNEYEKNQIERYLQQLDKMYDIN
jgi:glutamate racemase